MSVPLSNVAMRDVETLIHPYTDLDAFRSAGPFVLERGEGIHVFDSEGRRYIEGLSGLWCCSLGYGDEELVEAARDQLARLPYSHLFGGKSHEPAIELAERLKAIAPHPVSKLLFCCSGSEANDQQIKLAWYYNNAVGRPAKKKIISRERGYHGVTVAAAGLTGLEILHRDFDLPLPGILHVSCPDPYRNRLQGEDEAEFATRLAAELEAVILREGPETVAAFIAEPVMAAGGVIVPPATYFEKVGAVLQRHEVRLIADEVVCGFGRLGEWFGAQAMGMAPDSVSMAKGLSSAYLPIGAVSIDADMYEAMLEQSRRHGAFGHGYTYAAHPVAAAVACKVLEIYERRDILGHVRAVAPEFGRRLKALAAHPLVGDARCKGLIGALELVADKETKRSFAPGHAVAARAMAAAQERGLIVRALPRPGDTLGLCPPLIIDAEQVAEMFALLERALNDTEEWVRREGLRER